MIRNFLVHASLLHNAFINLLDYCCTAKVNNVNGAGHTAMITMIQRNFQYSLSVRGLPHHLT